MQCGTQKTFINVKIAFLMDIIYLPKILIKFLSESSDGIEADIRTLISGY